MDNKQIKLTDKKTIERILIALFCVFIAAVIPYVLFCSYKPDMNSLGALASVCMDVISIVILIVLVANLAFEKGEISRTTKLFLCLVCGTLYGLLFDFLTWSADGALAYGEKTYVFTIASLIGGSLMAAIFVLYLGSYMDEMYDISSIAKVAKICFVCNVIDFVVTLTLGITNKAFDFVDGHYETGTLYDVITVIPIITLLVLTGCIIRNVKIIGIHDVMAVVGYIFIMIAGTLIEATYSIGTTYVGITVANIFIFVMLQNKMINRVRQQSAALSEQMKSQFAILESMARIYLHVNFVDLENCTVRRFDKDESYNERFDMKENPHSSLNVSLAEGMTDEVRQNFWAYTDLSTLAERMAGEKMISAEFFHEKNGWFRAIYIRIGEQTDGPIGKVIYTIRNINEEKKNVEKWIRKSNTDELTGFFNRHAYEEEITALKNSEIKENFVYVSIDVNGLKMINDNLGHEAGDELIVGACECMKQCFGAYGKLFRTGGDEFVALIFADSNQLDKIRNDIREVTEKWKGKLNDNLTLSCGYVSQKEAENLTLHQIAVLADKRMYADKTEYYQKKGIDRRGQRDAHVALCDLYTKILKINITNDTYQIVNMDDDERTKEKGFADKISTWLSDFGTSGQVHPEDLDEYLSKTNLEYLSEYFRTNKKSLHVFYRRKYTDGYKRVIMEMIPANDYSNEEQTLFLYVKDIEG